jgi:hypothetical protein
MSTLPNELDFATNSGREATPERMNRAMEYLLGLVRALQASRPEFEAAVEQLRAIGLERVTEVLNPIFDQATAIKAALVSIQDEWTASTLPAQVQANAISAVTAAFADYRLRYMGAFEDAPTEREDGSAIGVGTLYFDLTLDAMRVMGAGGWKNAGSVVSAILNPFEVVATAGQTTFAIPGGYDVGMVIVAVNGALKGPAAYTATDGVDVVFPVGLNAGDKVSGYAFGAIALSSVYSKVDSDARYRLIADSYTKVQVDGMVGVKANTADVYSKTAADGAFLSKAANLAGLTDTAAARTALGLGSAATRADTYFAVATNVFTKAESDAKYALAASTLTLATGDARYPQKGDVYTTVEVDGAFLKKADNLASLTDKPAARGNLGLGSIATAAATAYVKASGIGTLSAGTADPTGGVAGDVYVKYTP